MDNIFKTLGASNHCVDERQEENFYSTDPIFINHIIEKEPWLKNPNLKILEPSAGIGTLGDRFYELTGNKMDMYDLVRRREDITQADYFETDFSNKYDVIITNPPYLRDGKNISNGLTDYVLKSLHEVKDGGTVIMFLKTLYLESQVRYDKLFKHYPPSKIYVYSDRINCYKNADMNDKQSAVSYSVFIWANKKKDGTFDNNTKLDWIRYK